MARSSGHPFRVRTEYVSAERVEGDVIAVNLRTGAYFSLSGPAADVWTAATSGMRDWMGTLDSAYGTTVPREQVDAFLASCEEHGLIEPMALDADAPSPAEPLACLPDDWPRGAWRAPVLEAFDDLQDLILVDPIHDASALGWPRIERVDEPGRS